MTPPRERSPARCGPPGKLYPLRMFWKKRRKGDRRIEERLRELESRARSASVGYDAQSYTRAGELCAEVGDVDRALSYYGQAIDSYLRAGRARAAAVLCRRIIALRPPAVRARCTLTLLSIGERNMDEAVSNVDAYVQAATNAGETRLAIRHLRLMADAADDPSFLSHLATLLRRLGETTAAAEIEVASRSVGADPDPVEHADSERWTKILQAALLGRQ